VTSGEQDARAAQGGEPSGHPREWLALVEACVQNGHALLADAELLLEHRRLPRALSLAVLAVEEYGKACQAMAVINSGGSDEELNEYRRLSTRHDGKITAALILRSVFEESEQFTDDFPEKLKRVVGESSTRKLHGFYVDRSPHGIRTPADIPTSDVADAVEVARAIADRWTRLLGPIEVEKHAEALWHFGPQLSAQMERAIEELDATPGEVLTAVRELLGSFTDATFVAKLNDMDASASRGDLLRAQLKGDEQAAKPMSYLGIDLAWAAGSGSRGPNGTGLVLLGRDGTVIAAGWARGLEETLAWIDEHCPPDDVLAFVDAPLVVTNPTGQRLCETQVGQRYGRWHVSANSTNLGSRNVAGVTLLRRLEERGWRYDDGLRGPPTHGLRISECYPYTTLVGVPALGYDEERPRYKRAPRGLPASAWSVQRATTCDDVISRLAGLTSFDPPLHLDSHPVTRRLLEEPSPNSAAAYKHREDLVDAVLCAWTAAIWHQHGETRCQVLGSERTGMDDAATIIAPARPEQRR
jgi:AbiV family abortive infection protein